jgi:hypothetical protein
MNTIINFISRHIRREQPILLGRWKIDYCAKKINDKIDFANVDHCGTCDHYLLKKLRLLQPSERLELQHLQE